MSSARNTHQSAGSFKNYLVNQNEGEEPEAETEKPAEQTSSSSYDTYSPKRVNFHTIRGKIRRYFA